MTVKLFTPPTLPARGYSQVCEITKGKLILFAGQVPHDVNDKLVSVSSDIGTISLSGDSTVPASSTSGWPSASRACS